MTDRFLNILKEKYSLSELDAGEFSSVKANGMKISVKAYRAEGLGHVSVMRAKGFFGLMKMDTFIIVPEQKDLPLYSYDRIYAMGNDTLLVEFYDTLINEIDLSALDGVKARYAELPDRDPGEHWYDDIKLSQSVAKKCKKANTPKLDELATEYFNAYLAAPCHSVSDVGKKKERSSEYIDGLLSNGGPSTDVFKKAVGAEKTTKFFKQVLFGTGL